MRAWAAAAALAFAACSRPAPPAPAPKGALQTAVERASAAPACAGKIPGQWSYSWPVPVARDGRALYRIFFFGRDGDAQKGFAFHQAEGDALLAVDGTVLECRRGAVGAPLPPNPPLRAALPFETRLPMEGRLFALTQDVGGLFASGRPLSDDEKKRVSEYVKLVFDLSETGHSAAYKASNPEFWIWAEKNTAVVPALK